MSSSRGKREVNVLAAIANIMVGAWLAAEAYAYDRVWLAGLGAGMIVWGVVRLIEMVHAAEATDTITEALASVTEILREQLALNHELAEALRAADQVFRSATSYDQLEKAGLIICGALSKLPPKKETDEDTN